MAVPKSAAIYARISSDPDGLALGVERQIQDCEKLAADLGWLVGEVYEDNDFSASTGKPRPAYLRMLDDIESGARDGVLVYHQDRLTRVPMEFEEFQEILKAADVRDVRFVTGLPGISSEGGLLALRILSAVAADETETKSRRVRRKMEQNAEAGLPHGGPHRPFGFEDDKVTHRTSEALVIRECAARVLAGESLRSVAAWLNETEVLSATGKPWQSTPLRTLLRNPRIAGLRAHKGEVIGPAVWDPIITAAERDQLIAVMDSRSRSGRRPNRRYLLSGLLRCGKCGHRLYSAPRKDTRRYVCSKGPDHGGCGGLSIVAAPVEEWIAQAVLFRLDTPELAAALAGKTADDERATELSKQLADDVDLMAELSLMFANREISRLEWMNARRPIEDRIEATERQLARSTGSNTLIGLAGDGKALAQSWADLNLDRQVAIVSAVLDHAVVAPGTPGARAANPDRVTPVWRL